MVFCTECGLEQSVGNFCARCGTPLLQNLPQKSIVEETPAFAFAVPVDTVPITTSSKVPTDEDVRDITRALEGSTYDWMHDGENVNGWIKLEHDGIFTCSWNKSRWSARIEGNSTFIVVVENIGGCGAHELRMNPELTAFTCSHSGQRGRLRKSFPPAPSSVVAELEGTEWEWLHNGRTVNGWIKLERGGRFTCSWNKSRWSAGIEGNSTVVVVVENIGGCGVHELKMNPEITEFTCEHSGQRGRLKRK